MFTQWAYGSQWPNLFATGRKWQKNCFEIGVKTFCFYHLHLNIGNSNWTQSTLVKECRKAKCVWWQHPENNCPDQLAGVTANQKKCTAKDSCSGTCTSTNCDCVEWYHQVNNNMYLFSTVLLVIICSLLSSVFILTFLRPGYYDIHWNDTCLEINGERQVGE